MSIRSTWTGRDSSDGWRLAFDFVRFFALKRTITSVVVIIIVIIIIAVTQIVALFSRTDQVHRDVVVASGSG